MRLTTTGPVQTARSMRHNVGHCSDSSSSTHTVTNDSAAAVSAAITSRGSSSPTTVANIMQLRRAICLTSTRADCHALSEPEPSPTTVSTDTYRKRPGTRANGNRRTASLRYHPDVATAEKSSSRVAAAEDLFRDTLAWLGADYGRQVFYVERDLAYTLQSHLVQRVESEHLPYRIYNDYPMIAGLRRSLSADLAIVSSSNEALVAAEFKYEPCHRRLDLLQNKLPVTVWAGIKKDTTRAVEFVNLNKTKVAYAVCVDEGNHLAKRDLSIYQEHLHWTGWPHHNHQIAVHISRQP